MCKAREMAAIFLGGYVLCLGPRLGVVDREFAGSFSCEEVGAVVGEGEGGYGGGGRGFEGLREERKNGVLVYGIYRQLSGCTGVRGGAREKEGTYFGGPKAMDDL